MLYDAIIVGGSFAGLNVARHLRGEVLLIDKGEIGSGQTSACGTPLRVVELLGAHGSVQQVHHSLVIHTASASITFPVREPYCTFDYAELCQALLQGVTARVLRAVVRGLDGDEVVTDRGRFRGRILVDASGWRAVLASSIVPGFVDRGGMSFGVETELPFTGQGLHFWLDPDVAPRGMGWVFPAGETARVGLASHQGESRLMPLLERFLGQQELAHGTHFHGGYYPWTLRRPVVGQLFVVGDAAGQCLAVTGEGIRPALCFGNHVGQTIQRVLDGEMSHEAALQDYGAFVAERRRYFSLMLIAQRLLDAVSNRQVTRLGHLATWRPLLNLFFSLYGKASDPSLLMPAEATPQPAH